MTTFRQLRSILLFLTVAGCATPSPESAPADAETMKTAIQAREREWSAAFLAADAAAVAALYTEDGASIQATGDWRRGREAIGLGMQPDFDSTTFTAREDITEEVIPLSADYLFEVGHYSSTGTSKADGTEKSSSGRYIVLWQRDADGVWRIHRDMGTAAPVKP